MGSIYGKDVRIEIGDGASGEAFDQIGGEVSFDWTRSSKEIDLSSKDDGAYAASGYGSQSVTLSINGKLKLPDTGLERAAAVAKTVPPTCNIRVSRGAITLYEGLMSVGNFSTSFPNDETATYKFEAKSAAAPTIDDLGATS